MKKILHNLLPAFLLAFCALRFAPCICYAANLQVASSLSKPFTEAILQGYQNTTGITADVTYIDPGTFTDRLNWLYRKKIDCIIGPNQEEFYVANHYNMLVPYASEQLFEIPQELQTKKNWWTNIWVDYIAFLCNKEKLEKLGIYAPDSWLGLLNPQLKNDIVVGDYETSKTTYSGIISLWQMQGEAASLNYAHNWNRHKVKFVKNDTDALEEVLRGKKALTIAPLSIALSLEKQNQQLYVTIPQDANKHLFAGAAIMKSSQQEQLARQFIDYLLSDAFVAYINAVSPYSLWHVKNFEDDGQLKAIIGNTKIAADDLGWSAITKKEILRQWKKS